MKINYESTINEAVNAQLRLMERTNTYKKWRWQGLMGAPIAVAIAYFAIPFSLEEKLVFSSVSGLFYVAAYLAVYKPWTRGRIRNMLVEMLGSNGPFPTEYRLEDDALATRVMGTEIKFDWGKFTEVNETEGDIELIAGKSGIAILPKRVFQNDEQLNEWLSRIKEKTGIS